MNIKGNEFCLYLYIAEEGTEMGLKINIKKTKYLVVLGNKNEGNAQLKLTLNGTNIKRVERYKYLGTWVNSEADPDTEIKSRTEIARKYFQ